MSASAFPATNIQAGSLPPKSWTIAAWAAAAAMSVVVTYLLTTALGVAFIGFGFLITMASFAQVRVAGILAGLFLVIVGGTVLWSLIPRNTPLEMDGVAIDLEKEARLRAELQAIARIMGEPMPAEVRLIGAANAAVLQHKGKRRMLVGLPLLQLLTVSQFRAVAAHEFAHFYAGDTQIGPWVFRARDKMTRVIANLTGESAVLSLLRKWAIVAILHLIIVGGLVLYWKLLARITLYISRRQEFRCDELACHVAGSESLDGGLRNVRRAGAGTASYWTHVGAAMANGFRPQVADGFARFMRAPAIRQAVAAYVEAETAATKVSGYDTHPPLGARLEKIRALAIIAVDHDERPAIDLIADLPGLELGLLQKMAPDANVAGMKTVGWDLVGAEVYLPFWRKQTEPLRELLGPCSIPELADKLQALPGVAQRLPDPPGTLPTREQRLARATELLRQLFTLALVDGGWRLHFQPGEFYLEQNAEKLEPGRVLTEMNAGQLTAAAWEATCKRLGMENLALVSAG